MFERLAIVGAGAIGSTIGGYLARAGHDVTLIDPWAAHVDAIRRNGLTVSAADEEFIVPVKAIHVGDVCNLAARFDAVFICVKSYDTTWATHLIRPHLSPTSVIVSAQNGVNEESIAPVVGFDSIIGCVITLGARLVEPGRVLRHSGPKGLAFTLGQPNGLISRRVRMLGEVMTTVGAIELTTNLWGHRWSHVARNSMVNPISALMGLGTGEIRRTEGIVDVIIKIAAEAVGVARALGVEVEPITGIPAETYERADDPRVMEEIKEKLAEVSASVGDDRPSMYQDVVKGRRTEIDYLNGYVVARGKGTGVDTHLNEATTGLVKRLEAGELQPDPANLELLEPYA